MGREDMGEKSLGDASRSTKEEAQFNNRRQRERGGEKHDPPTPEDYRKLGKRGERMG